MHGLFIQYIVLVLIILGLVMSANKLRVAYPIVLVLGGLALSFTSEFSNITIHPELVFFIFLPPLLYEAAWQVSWKEFWRWRRLIASFAFPIVIITSCVIAFASYALIPGFTLALGFLLGGIISPPDAVSATTNPRRAGVSGTDASVVIRKNSLADYERIYLELLERQRKLLKEMNRSDEFDEELIRKYLSLIDVEEFEVREKRVT